MITTPLTTDLVRGVAELEPTPRGLRLHRLPTTARAQTTDGQLHQSEGQPAGVRLEFHTSARRVELDLVPTKRVYPGAPPRPDGVHEIVVDGAVLHRRTADGGDTVTIDLATQTARRSQGEATTLTVELPEGGHDVEWWLPHDEETELVALRSDAPVTALPRSRPVWLHHGSSISHGSNATTPTGTWPAVAARLAGLDLVNLGLGGSALLDPFVARTMRDTPADVVSLKLGINLVNQDLLRVRALGPAVHGFLDTIRDGHPDAPLLLVTPIHCAIHEDTPGPTAFDPASLATGRLRFVAAGDPTEVASGKLTLRVVREVLAEVVDSRGDGRLVLVDGLSLYGADDAARLPMPDDLHPDPATHRLIGERFAELALAPLA
ncbi:SGNH/GDSL hydrolase family protein [Nocardioides aestuarii]|uniref:SGNH/GDSL hydrolase family protein n=1 Tax=Nocardioides aestuarii TaxID=252231 RepID=A0ABW4TK88_9ACTN